MAVNKSFQLRILVPAFSLTLGVTLSACGTSLHGAAKLGAGGVTGITVAPALPVPASSTTSMPSTTPVTGPPGVNPGTIVVPYPNPYAPSYDTLQSLVSDATFIVLATVLPQSSATNNYPLQQQQSFLYEARSSMSISPKEFAAAHLSVGGTYLFFWADDTVDSTYCIVGGVRGVFAYNPSTQTITRIDQNAASQIPQTQTLAQFGTAVAAAANAVQSSATRNHPPMCSPSATGIS